MALFGTPRGERSGRTSHPGVRKAQLESSLQDGPQSVGSEVVDFDATTDEDEDAPPPDDPLGDTGMPT